MSCIKLNVDTGVACYGFLLLNKVSVLDVSCINASSRPSLLDVLYSSRLTFIPLSRCADFINRFNATGVEQAYFIIVSPFSFVTSMIFVPRAYLRLAPWSTEDL